MCTVSFYKYGHETIITSNRDENLDRPTAIPPKKIPVQSGWAYAPIDPKSGGTWFGVRQDGNVYVLLNGATEAHRPVPPYIKSRGTIMMEFLTRNDFVEHWGQIDLFQIEPFTLIAYVDKALHHVYWDGSRKTNKHLNPEIPHIWSSSTLYGPQVRPLRKQWFMDFIKENHYGVNSKSLLDFHRNTKSNDLENGLIIKRSNNMSTKSITQCLIEQDALTLTYLDLVKNKKNIVYDTLNKPVVA